MNLKIDGKTISDIIIGMSDGLTVPFALAAGLAGAIAQSNVVLSRGLGRIGSGWHLNGFSGKCSRLCCLLIGSASRRPLN